MPPVGATFRRSAGDARIRWLDDGYPGRVEPNADEEDAFAHPIFGTYALADYIEQYWRGPSVDLSDAIRTVAQAALGRMEPHRDALVFWYEESPNSSRSTTRHYSGLTQSYYAVNLARAARVLRDEAMAEAASRVFAALLIPAADGGVYTEGQLGPSIAQVPQEPSGFILNGWQSALASMLEFADVVNREDARELANSSAREMARMLPLYDAAAFCNSRYGLSGFVYVRLVFRGPHLADVAISGASISIQGDTNRQINALGGPRYQNHLLAKDVDRHGDGSFQVRANIVRMNVVLSRVSFPAPNRLGCTVAGPGGTIDVQVQRGRYDPLSASPADREWVTVSRVECPAGSARIDIPLPWDVTDLVAYPTNFAKKVDGQHTNVYHMTHIRRLRELSIATGITELREWADTWTRYVGCWGSMPEYRGLHVRWGRETLPVEEAARALPFWSAEPLRA